MSDRDEAYKITLRRLSSAYYDFDKIFGRGLTDEHPEILGLFLIACALEAKK